MRTGNSTSRSGRSTMSDLIKYFDLLPPDVRRALRAAPANLDPSEIYELYRTRGAHAALDAIVRFCRRNRPEFVAGKADEPIAARRRTRRQ